MQKDNLYCICEELNEFEKALKEYCILINQINAESGHISKMLDQRLCEIIDELKKEIYY